MKRITNGFFNPVFPCSHASTHNGNATIFQRGVYIGKVEIYIAVNRDDFGYAFAAIVNVSSALAKAFIIVKS